MEASDLLTERAGDFDGVKRRIVQLALGYLGLACLAVYVDYRIRLRRAKRRRKPSEELTPQEEAWFKEEDDDDSGRHS